MNRRGWAGGWPGKWALGMAALAVLLTPSLRAQDAGQSARAVRLSYVDGQVRILQGGQLLADPALVNTPLFEGAQVTTGDDGRAELQFDDGSVARLAPNSSVMLAVLRGADGQNGDTGGDAEMVLQNGLGYFELQGESQTNHIRIRFGSNVVTASGLSVLRVDLDNLPGEVAVFSGNAHLESNAATSTAMTIDLQGGESITLSENPSQYVLSGSIEPDSWDAWNADRDQALTAEAADRTNAPMDAASSATDGAADTLASSDNPAWNDLDANGNWYDVPGQGEVWSPYDAANAGWDPYGNGSWMWTPDFGYVWVSSAAWGYLPYQCGQWNYYNGFGWGWAPGRRRPWWNGGGWKYRMGNTPSGYHFPDRPHEGDGGWRHDRNGGPRQAGFEGSSHPVVAVNRLPDSPPSVGRPSVSGRVAFAARDRNRSVIIAGHSVQPLRPVASRPLYSRSSSTVMTDSRPAYAGGWTYAGQRSIHSGNTFPARSFGSPARSYGGGQRSSAGHFSPRGGSSPARSWSGGGGRSRGGGSSGGGYSGGHH